MKILFIGDIMGEPGRRVLLKHLSKVIEDFELDVVVGNGENAAVDLGLRQILRKNSLIWVFPPLP